MSNVRIFNKEIKKEKSWQMFIRCYVFGQLSSVRNLCYSKISVVMLLGYGIAGISRKIRVRPKRKYALRPNAAYLNS